MAIKATDKPDACTCKWEDVTMFENREAMIMMTIPDPDCPIHAERDEPKEIRRNMIFPGNGDDPAIRLMLWSDGSVTWSNHEWPNEESAKG